MLTGKALYEYWRVNARWSCGVKDCVGDVLHHGADTHVTMMHGTDGATVLVGPQDGVEVYKDGRTRLVAFACGGFGRIVVGKRYTNCIYAVTIGKDQES